MDRYTKTVFSLAARRAVVIIGTVIAFVLFAIWQPTLAGALAITVGFGGICFFLGYYPLIDAKRPQNIIAAMMVVSGAIVALIGYGWIVSEKWMLLHMLASILVPLWLGVVLTLRHQSHELREAV